MDLFEYQGKQLFARYGIPVSDGEVAETVDDAVAIADRVGYPVVVKAQVQVGGRGKAGGVKLATNTDEARTHAGNILGLDIKGHVVKRIWVEHASDIAEEYYASFTLDRAAKKYLGMLSAQGGVEIETVAEENPEALLARRRALIERHEAELVNRRTQLAADREAEAERVRGELLRWRADQWKLVNLIVQMMLAVAFELEATQPETSKALIAIARRADSCGGIDLPRRPWWQDLGRSD